MKRILLTHIVPCLSLAILVTAPAYAEPFNLSTSATIFWDSLRITTDPGIQITWLGSSNRTEGVGILNGSFLAQQSSNNWVDPLSFNSQSGGLIESGNATANSLSSGISWSYPSTSGNIDSLAFVRRWGNFLVEGSGTATFAIDYKLDGSRSADTSSFPVNIETSAVMNAEFQLFIPYVITYKAVQQASFIADQMGPANDSMSQEGTLTFQYGLSNGATYWIDAIVSCDAQVTVPVPEPSSLFLLGFGLIALTGYGRRKI
jgi:hypothetical protein